MRRFLLSFLLLGMTTLATQAQIVITEINYNSPEGADIEFIELLNNSSSMVDLSGWSFAQGVTYTFPSGVMLAPNAYLVVTGDSIRFQNGFGFPAFEWTSGGLSNSGEDIIIVDNQGTGIDTVDYEDNTLGWPTAADGQGPSLSLCDVNADNNDPANWGISIIPTAVREDEDSARIFATPGALNQACPSVPAYFFNGTYAEVTEGVDDSATVSFIVSHTGPLDTAEIITTINAGASTATEGVDFNFTTTITPISPEGTGGITFVDITFPINDDAMVEGDEFIVFNNLGANVVNGVVPQFLAAGVFTIKVIDDDAAAPIVIPNIVITEINYNSPEGDDIEFVELYNNDTLTVDFTDWTFTQGFDYTFPSGIVLGPGGLLVISDDSVAFTNAFGIPARQWTSGGLSNGGEDIILEDSAGNVVDIVDYDDGNGWPRAADGQGPSLSICDPNLDNNDPANWGISTVPSPVREDDDSARIFATPLAPIFNCPTAPVYFFNGTYAEVVEGDSAEVSILVSHTGPTDSLRIDLTLNAGLGTATDGVDFTYTTITTPVSPEGVGGWTFIDIKFPTTDDSDVEGDETVVFNMGAAPVNGVVPQFIDAGPFVVKILDNDTPLPLYNIDLLTTDNDANGLADSIDTRCDIRGIVHGVNTQGTSGRIAFTVIDSTGGIGVFSDDAAALGYTVQEGDDVRVRGTVSEFRGLAQMTAEEVEVFSSNNPTVMPASVTTLDESTENELLILECFKLVDPSEWPGPGSEGSGANVSVTNGVDTLTLRIDGDVDVYGTDAPTSTWLDIIGIGGQFSFNPSDLDGYQLLPRYTADIVELGNPQIDFGFATDTLGETSGSLTVGIDIVNGNPDTTTFTVSLGANGTATLGADFDFSDTTFTFVGCNDDSAFFDISILDDADTEGEETVELVISSVTNGETTVDTLTVVIIDDESVSIKGQLSADAISLYPNPAQNVLVVEANLFMESIEVQSLLGQTLMHVDQATQRTELNISQLPAGTYLLRAQTAQGPWIAKWTKR